MHNAVPLLQDYLSNSARRLPDKVALVCQSQRITYRELEQRSNSLAHSLIERSIERGDRVVIFAENSIEVAVSFWAVLKIGAVVSIVSPLTKADKLSYLLNDCRAKALISDAQFRATFLDAVLRTCHLTCTIVGGQGQSDWLDRLPGGTSFDTVVDKGEHYLCPTRRSIDIDLAALIYTSGSTGVPKGVMLTHRNMLTAASSVSESLGYREQDVVLSTLPLSFDYGLYQMIMCAREGARLILERSFTYPTPVLHQVAKEQCTVFPLVPTIVSILTEMRTIGDFDLSPVRLVTNTAAALSEKHIAAILRIFPGAQLCSMFGLTECKRCTYLPPSDLARKPGSVGIAIPNTEVWVVDDNGQPVAPGIVGELVVRGGTVMRGYWEKPEATAKRLKPGPLAGELVLYTGDFCRQDEDGYVYFVSRMDDIIKSRGEKVAPKEVESQVACIPGVKECAVIGVPDSLLGEAVKCFVVLEQGATLTEMEIQKETLLRLESFMVPKYIAIVTDLPKTNSGKVSKIGLS